MGFCAICLCISSSILAVFCNKLRAPHRGTSLRPFVCGAQACSLCSFPCLCVCINGASFLRMPLSRREEGGRLSLRQFSNTRKVASLGYLNLSGNEEVLCYMQKKRSYFKTDNPWEAKRPLPPRGRKRHRQVPRRPRLAGGVRPVAAAARATATRADFSDAGAASNLAVPFFSSAGWSLPERKSPFGAEKAAPPSASRLGLPFSAAARGTRSSGVTRAHFPP